mmetsp:Transcript_27491/g.40610  ORF Transcript_27491/g.40610 Transcript_27491/m.40610 type:complete len:120 (+) Transcript_27491:219-578(+)
MCATELQNVAHCPHYLLGPNEETLMLQMLNCWNFTIQSTGPFPFEPSTCSSQASLTLASFADKARIGEMNSRFVYSQPAFNGTVQLIFELKIFYSMNQVFIVIVYGKDIRKFFKVFIIH